MISNFLYRVLKIPLTMRVRSDRSPKNPDITVIFLHGIASSSLAWKDAISHLSKDPDLKNARFISLDLIGFGKSPKASWFSYKYSSYRRSLHRSIKKLHIKTPIILAGHSMGCLISVNYAAYHPKHIKALVLVSPPLLRPNDISKVADQFYYKTYASLKKHSNNPAVGTLAAFVSKISSFEHKYFNTPAFRKSLQKIILNKNNWASILSLDIPIHFVHGRLDPLVIGANLRTLARKRKNIDIIESIGGHDITPPKLRKVVRVIKTTIIQSASAKAG